MNRNLVVSVIVAIIIGGLFGFALAYSVFQPLQQDVSDLKQTISDLNQQINDLNQSLDPLLNSSIRLGYQEGLGYYFEDMNGLTLYYFARDVPSSGRSSYTITTPAIWTRFYASKITLPLIPSIHLNQSDFTAITNMDGSNQTTYRGWPLYYFSNDTTPGDTKGQGFNDLWWVMKPSYTVMIAYKDEVGGRYLTNAYGFTLYEFTNDTQGSGVSACVGTCEINWPPFYVQSIDAPSLVSRAQFDYITLNSGNKEVTYSGWPLHYFADDLKPGETNGQGFLDVWFAMMPMTP